MEFRILGSLEVVGERAPLEVGARRLRLFLALLVIRSPMVVAAERLIDDLWDTDPPETARHTLQGYAYRLRQALGPDGWRLETRQPGYRLKISSDELDARRFEVLAERGRAAVAGGRADTATELLSEALRLWRGPVLADLPEVPGQLDNFEHVLPAATVVGNLLDAAPGLRILVTSRSPLRLSGEQEYRLPPLPAPRPDEPETNVEQVGFDALTLFADRARDVQRDFMLTHNTTALVADVVARVDGLPLAIELAATRLRLFPLAQLRDRLTSVLPLLTEGPTDVPTRQRALRDAIAWSHDLPDPADQALFRRLGIFRGGFTFDAAEAIAPDTHAEGLLRAVSSLIEASLLQVPIEADAVRYSMLETVREYALEQLHIHGEYDDVARLHADFYAGLVERAEPELTRAEQPRWLRRLEADHDNLRAVLRWATTTGDLDVGLIMAGRLWRFWHFRGRLTEGRSWLEDLLASAEQVPNVPRTKALLGLAGLCYWQADLDGAEARYQQAVDAARRLDRETADAAGSHDLLAPWWLELEALLGLVTTVACHRGDPEASALLEEQFQAIVAQHPHDPLAMGTGMATSMLIRLFTGDLEGSRSYGELVAAGTREIGERWYEGQTLRTLALVSLRQHRHEQAEAELRECLDIAADLGDLPAAAMDLDRLGQAAIALGLPRRAVTLAGAASRLRESVGGGLAIDDFRWETVYPVDAARRVLGESEVDVVWARGQLMSLDDAFAYAKTYKD